MIKKLFDNPYSINQGAFFVLNIVRFAIILIFLYVFCLPIFLYNGEASIIKDVFSGVILKERLYSYLFVAIFLDIVPYFLISIFRLKDIFYDFTSVNGKILQFSFGLAILQTAFWISTIFAPKSPIVYTLLAFLSVPFIYLSLQKRYTEEELTNVSFYETIYKDAKASFIFIIAIIARGTFSLGLFYLFFFYLPEKIATMLDVSIPIIVTKEEILLI